MTTANLQLSDNSTIIIAPNLSTSASMITIYHRQTNHVTVIDVPTDSVGEVVDGLRMASDTDDGPDSHTIINGLTSDLDDAKKRIAKLVDALVAIRDSEDMEQMQKGLQSKIMQALR